MPGEQMFVNSTPASINNGIVRQLNAQPGSFNGNGYVSTISNGRVTAEYRPTLQPRVQGLQLQNANSNNSYEVRPNDHAQRNANSCGSRADGSSRTEGRSLHAQLSAAKNNAGGTTGTHEHVSDFSALFPCELKTAPNRRQSIYKAPKAAAHLDQSTMRGFANSTEAADSQFTHSSALESLCSTKSINTQNIVAGGTSKIVSRPVEISLDGLKYISSESRGKEAEYSPFIYSVEACKRAVERTNNGVASSRTRFQGACGGRNHVAASNGGAATSPKTVVRNFAQSPRISMSTTQVTTTFVSNPSGAAFQHFPPNVTLVKSPPAKTTKSTPTIQRNELKQFSQVRDPNIATLLKSPSAKTTKITPTIQRNELKQFSQVRGPNIAEASESTNNGATCSSVARLKVSRQGSFGEDNLPKIVACYSLKSETTSKSKFEPSQSGARIVRPERNFIDLTRPQGQFYANSALNRAASLTSSPTIIPFRQVIVKNDRHSKTPCDPVHVEEAIAKTVRNAALLAEQQEAIDSSVFNSSGQTLVKQSPSRSSPSGRSRNCGVKSPDSASKIARRNARITAKGTSLRKPASHSQFGESSLDSWFKSTQTSSLSMHVVGNYPSPIIISKLPKLVNHNEQRSAAINAPEIKSCGVSIAQSLSLSASTKHQSQNSTVVVSTSTGLASASTAQTSRSSVIMSRACNFSKAGMVMLNSSAQSLAKSVAQSNITQPQYLKLNCETDHDLVRREKVPDKSEQTIGLPLDYSMTTLRKLEWSLKGLMQEEPMDLSLPKARQIRPLELKKPTAGEDTETGHSVSSHAGPKQLEVPALVDQAATTPDTANLDTLCTVALSLSLDCEKQLHSKSITSHSTTLHSDNSSPKSARAVTETLDCVTSPRKSTRLAEKHGKKRGKRLSIGKDGSFSIASESSLASENVNETVEASKEEGVDPCFNIPDNSPENEISVQKIAENENQDTCSTQKSRMRKHRKKARKTRQKRFSKRKPIVLKISKKSENRLFIKQTCCKSKVYKNHQKNASLTEKHAATCFANSSKSTDFSVNLEAKRLKHQRVAQDKLSETASIFKLKDSMTSKTMQGNEMLSKNAVSSEEPQNDAIEDNVKEITLNVQAVDAAPNMEIPEAFYKATAAANVKRDDEMKEKKSNNDNVENIAAQPDKPKNRVKSGKIGKTCDKKCPSESVQKETETNVEESAEADKARSEEREKPLSEKDVNQPFSSEGDIVTVGRKLSDPLATNTVCEDEIASKAKPDMSGVVAQKTALLDDISKRRNSPNVSLWRLNSDEMKSNFSVVSDNELINITPESLDTMIKAKENMIAGEGALLERKEGKAAEIGKEDRSNEQIIDVISQEEIPDLNKTMSSEKKHGSVEYPTQKEAKSDDFTVFVSAKDVSREEISRNSKVLEEVEKEIETPETPNETMLQNRANKYVGSELNTEMAAGSVSKDNSITENRGPSKTPKAGWDDDLSPFKDSGEEQKGQYGAADGHNHPRDQQNEEFKISSVVKKQANNLEGEVQDIAINGGLVLNDTGKEIRNVEANDQNATIISKAKEEKGVENETAEPAARVAKRRRVVKVSNKASAPRRKVKALRRIKRLNLPRSSKPTAIEPLHEISPILERIRCNLDSDSAPTATKKRTMLKLGYNANAGWTGGELKIKRRKLVKKETNSSAVQALSEHSLNKSALTYILFSDSSDSSGEGTDVISTTKVKKRSKRRDKTRLETCSSLPKSMSRTSRKKVSLTPIFERFVQEDTLVSDVVDTALPETAKSKQISSVIDENVSTNSSSLNLEENILNTSNADQNNTVETTEDHVLPFEGSKLNLTTTNTQLERPKTRRKPTGFASALSGLREFSTEKQMFTATRRPTASASPVTPISADAAPSDDGDKPKPSAKSFVKDPYAPGSDDLSDASSENRVQSRAKTQQSLGTEKNKKQHYTLSKRARRVGDLPTLKRKRQKKPLRSVLGFERMKKRQINGNSTMPAPRRDWSILNKEPEESLKDVVDEIIRTAPMRKKCKTLPESKGTKSTAKTSAKVEGTKSSNISTTYIDDSDGKDLNEPSVPSSKQEDRPLLHKTPMARISMKWKSQEWPDVTKVACKPLPFYEKEVITKEEREDNIFMAMQKLLKMGVITDQISRIPHATARKTSTTKKEKEAFVQAKAPDVISTLPQQKSERDNTQNSVHCILGEGIVIKPCSIVMKRLNIHRNTVRLIL